MANDPTNYNLCVYCGPQPPVIEDLRVVDVTAPDASIESVAGTLAQSGLTPSDFRARAVFICDADPELALVTYAALCGFATRALDVVSRGTTVRAAQFDRPAGAVVPRPPATPELLYVGRAAPAAQPLVSLLHERSTAETAMIQHASRVVLTADPATPVALGQFLMLAALRRRGHNERFPLYAASADSVPVDLELARRRGAEVRKSTRPDTMGSLVDQLPPTPRQERLSLAASSDVTTVLLRLGVTYQVGDDGVVLWHCPRPERHTNGDANPSTRVTKELRVRCFRCDPEPVDALGLVMDALSMTGDEAAEWILTPVPVPAS